MSALRFAAGERAVFMVATDSSATGHVGSLVEVSHVGPFQNGDRVLIDGSRFGRVGACDYVISWLDKHCVGICRDWQLRKLDPPAEPVALRHHASIGATP